MDQSSNNNNTNKKTVQFAEDSPVEHDASYSFEEDDIETLFYTNEEVNEILKECKEQNDLPLFWRPLRVSRIELLWDEVDKEQYHQRNKLSETQAAKRDLLEDMARVSRRISQPQQRMAAKEATKIAQEVEELMSAEEEQEEGANSNLTSSSSHKSLEDDGPTRLNGLQSMSRNSIAASVA